MNDYLIGIKAVLLVFGPVLVFLGVLARMSYLDKQHENQKLRDQLTGKI